MPSATSVNTPRRRSSNGTSGTSTSGTGAAFRTATRGLLTAPLQLGHRVPEHGVERRRDEQAQEEYDPQGQGDGGDRRKAIPVRGARQVRRRFPLDDREDRDPHAEEHDGEEHQKQGGGD